MPFRDILLHVTSYPDATTPKEIEQAGRLARALGGDLSVLALTVQAQLQGDAGVDALVGLSPVSADEEARSRNARDDQVAQFAKAAAEASVLGDIVRGEMQLFDTPQRVAAVARCLPYPEG